MAFAQMGVQGSPFAALLGHLGAISHPSPLVPNPTSPPVDVTNGFRATPGIHWFGPGGSGISYPQPSPIVPNPNMPEPQPGIPPSLSGLGSPPNLGLFPHPDPATAMAQIHQVVGHHHGVLQVLLAAIHGLANAPVGVDASGHTQPGIHSQSTHNATVARRNASSRPLPLQ